MFKIDKSDNRIERLAPRSFLELGFKERQHLQEWIANKPDALGEDLLIIQKEFAGFSDTSERLDLLAIDKQGSLVIIENKLDDTGRDVTWQALKYASYCARLTKDDIKNVYQSYLDRHAAGLSAEEQLCSFLEEDEYQDVALNKGVTQRIMLVAANFRKEVTSTVLWLSSFKLRIQCFKVTPFAQGDDLFLTVEQIIPTKDAEDFMIGLAAKAQDEVNELEAEKTRYVLRREFWSKLLSAMNSRSQLFRSISPGPKTWISVGSGVSGIIFSFVIARGSARVEVYINTARADLNHQLLEQLRARRDHFETRFGGSLTWDDMEGSKPCRILCETPGNYFDKSEWSGMIDFMVDAMIRLHECFRDEIPIAVNSLR